MPMVDSIINLFLVNMYWFSLPLIGFATLGIINSFKKTPQSVRLISSYILRQHPFTVFVMSFAVAVAMYALLSILFYIFKLPVWPFVVIYLILAAISVIYVLGLLFKNEFGRQITYKSARQLNIFTGYLRRCPYVYIILRHTLAVVLM